MWGLVLVYFLFQSLAFGLNSTELNTNSDEASSLIAKALNKMKMNEFESLLEEMKDWRVAATEYVREKSESVLEHVGSDQEGRRLKYKRAEMKFLMKSLVIFKVLLGLFLPVGVIASKIISWKALTLSLMAFMLAKILFVKNLLMGRGAFSVTPTNYVPPFYVHGGVNDVFLKRQGETQIPYT